MIRSLAPLIYLFLLPLAWADGNKADWLIRPESFEATVKQSDKGRELELANGLLMRYSCRD